MTSAHEHKAWTHVDALDFKLIPERKPFLQAVLLNETTNALAQLSSRRTALHIIPSNTVIAAALLWRV